MYRGEVQKARNEKKTWLGWSTKGNLRLCWTNGIRELQEEYKSCKKRVKELVYRNKEEQKDELHQRLSEDFPY